MGLVLGPHYNKAGTMADHRQYMEETFGDEWRACVREGRCWIVQDTLFNPYDGQGLDLRCLVHDARFNVPTERGVWDVVAPTVCPGCAKSRH